MSQGMPEQQNDKINAKPDSKHFLYEISEIVVTEIVKTYIGAAKI